MLAIVEHQQHILVFQLGHQVRDSVFRSSLDSEHISNPVRYEIGSVYGVQIDPKKSVLIIASELSSNRVGHGTLPNSTWSGDRDEPVPPQFASQLFDDLVL